MVFINELNLRLKKINFHKTHQDLSLRASSPESQTACGQNKCSCMLNRGLWEEFCTRVHTHVHISICVVENGSLKDKTSSTLTATEMQVYFSWQLYQQGDFFCKCNAKTSDAHNVSLYTVDECIGGRWSLLSRCVLAVSVFVEEAY